MTIEISPAQTILLAKTRHLDELERLDTCIAFVEKIGLLIHQLQAERGASCLYLASGGQRFLQARADIIADSLLLESDFRNSLQQHLERNALAGAKELTLISWVLLGLDQLTSFRRDITLHKISFVGCIELFSRLIGTLIALIFEITDNSVNSKISTCLLTLYNLVQGKEFAGQERAVGAYLFGSGSLQSQHQQRLLELIDQQDRHFELFCQLGDEEVRQSWEGLRSSGLFQQHLKYRHKLTSAKDQQMLDPEVADIWFDLCSQRLTGLWHIQCQLVKTMHQMLESLAHKAKSDLEQTQQHLRAITSRPATGMAMDTTFFNLAIPVEGALNFQAHEPSQAYPVASMINLLQQQSRQIADMESELSDTKKALAERKQIERAKGLLMSTLGINEMEAYKTLRNTAMEQNRKVIDVAENILISYKQAG